MSVKWMKGGHCQWRTRSSQGDKYPGRLALGTCEMHVRSP